jgi:hypothetical protein
LGGGGDVSAQGGTGDATALAGSNAGRSGNGGAGGVTPSGGAGAGHAGSTGAAARGGASAAAAGNAGVPVVAGAGAGGSADGFTIDARLASDIDPTALATVGIVTWSLDQAPLTEAHIDFGLDTTYGMTAPVDLTLANYRSVLVGMKPQKTYHFRIVATNGPDTFTSDDRTLVTGALASVPSISGFSVLAKAQVDPGFFIGSNWSTDMSNDDVWTVFILDTDGDVVWTYTAPIPSNPGELGFGRARLSADSKDVWLAPVSNGGGPLRRVSIDSLEVETYSNTRATHDIAAVSGDTMAYLDLTNLSCASIVEIDKSGTTKPVFDPTGVTTPAPMCHVNSLRYSKTEDVYVYSELNSDVVVLSRDGSLKWKLTDKVSGGHMSWGGLQHGTQLLDESLLIFANYGAGTEQSEAIEFGLDGSLLRRFMSRGGTDFLGDVERLPSGNTLIDYGSLIQEVDASDNVVLEIDASVRSPFAYVEFRQSLYGLPLDIQE